MMKTILLLSVLLLIYGALAAQPGQYEPSDKNPFGLKNPDAPPQLSDYDKLIGTSICKSINRNLEGVWQDTVSMKWTFRYIMDGTAIEDVTIKDDGAHGMSIRQYRPDSAKWYVTYFSRNNPPNVASVWSGNATESGEILLEKNQSAPNGLKGISQLKFSKINEEGFNWEGSWIGIDTAIVFPFWRIHCVKKSQ